MEEKKIAQDGLRLKEFRKFKKISQKELADSLGCSQPNLSKIESGELGISSSLREKLIEGYPEINPNWLFTGTGEMIIEVYDPTFISNMVIEEPEHYEIAHQYFVKFEKLISEGKVPNNVIASIFSDMRRILKFQEETLSVLKKSTESLTKSVEKNFNLKG